MPTKLTAEQIKFSTVDGSIPLDNSSITMSGVTYPLQASKIVQTLANYTPPTGSQQYTSPGTYSWICPSGVFSVSAVAVGGGGGGYDTWTGYCGAGGGLGWKNNISVTPGQTYTVVVGAGGLSSPDNGGANVTLGGNSYFISLQTVAGYGGGNGSFGTSSSGPNANGYGGGYVGDGGGAGGNSSGYYGGGGAGGYTGRGGNQQETWNSTVNGGYGGSYYSSTYGCGSGGGVGLSGATGYPSPGNAFYNPFTGYNNSSGYGNGGQGAHGGSNGQYGENPFSGSGQSSSNIQGGSYGGGGGGAGTSWPSAAGNGGGGGVRIIWGANRSYPNNAT